MLAAVNELFGAHFGGEFQELAAAAEFPDPVFGHPVELLVTDKESYKDSGVHWRRGEARAVARRVRELVDSGAATPGEIVLLFAAGTDAEWYEDELRRAGLPTYRATGKGYFGQQQVVDLLMYLRLLQNRYDDTALLSVLASPFVGVSNDALALLRRVASRRPLFSGLEHSLPPGLAERDERLMRAFRQRYDRLVEAMPRLSLERLCEQIVAAHDYDLAVLAQWDGRRRYANMRKLARLARSYEELRGPDVEGFVRFVAEQEAVGARELEAVAEEEGADAVRLLTIHAAKGLEFKVVIVADAGRDRVPPSPDEILALPDGRFGFRVADPVTAKRRGAFDYEAVKEARQEAERAERLRLYYVAMTRAKERLIVSGSVDLGSERETPTPIAWVLDRLAADEELGQAGDAPVELVRGDARLLVRLDRFHPEERGRRWRSPRPRKKASSRSSPRSRRSPRRCAAAPELPPLVALPDPPLHRVRRLSFTSISLFEQCAYKYFARYGLGMSERPVEVEGVGERSGTEIGSAVHALLEEIDLAAPVVPELEDELIRGFVAAYCDSDLARRVAAPRGRREGAPLHVRARRRARARLHRRLPSARRPRARRRLQDERPRRGVAGRDRRAGLPAAAARLRARVLPRGRRGGRGRLPLPRAAGRAGGGRLHGRRRARARGRAVRRDRAHPGRRVPADAERVRLRRLPGARPRLRRPAPAPAAPRGRCLVAT